jgi:hypothetical protein
MHRGSDVHLFYISPET